MRTTLIACTAVLLLAVVLFNRPVAEAQQQPPVQKWEYLRVYTLGVNAVTEDIDGATHEVTQKTVARLLSELGASGWEMVGFGKPDLAARVVQRPADVQYIFKRPIR